jgi:hypothetical protein
VSVVARPTVRTLTIERQEITCEGTTRSIVRIPDYQVKLSPGTPWHRRGSIEGETSCGALLNPNNDSLRAYLLDDDLCADGCFSPHELRLGRAYGNARFDVSDVGDD